MTPVMSAAGTLLGCRAGVTPPADPQEAEGGSGSRVASLDRMTGRPMGGSPSCTSMLLKGVTSVSDCTACSNPEPAYHMLTTLKTGTDINSKAAHVITQRVHMHSTTKQGP